MACIILSNSANEESSQEFVPFIRDVHIGNTEHANQQPCSSGLYHHVTSF